MQEADYSTIVCLILGGLITGEMSSIPPKWSWGEGGLGQTLIKDKPKKVKLVVFLSKTGT